MRSALTTNSWVSANRSSQVSQLQAVNSGDHGQIRQTLISNQPSCLRTSLPFSVRKGCLARYRMGLSGSVLALRATEFANCSSARIRSAKFVKSVSFNSWRSRKSHDSRGMGRRSLGNSQSLQCPHLGSRYSQEWRSHSLQGDLVSGILPVIHLGQY